MEVVVISSSPKTFFRTVITLRRYEHQISNSLLILIQWMLGITRGLAVQSRILRQFLGSFHGPSRASVVPVPEGLVMF